MSPEDLLLRLLKQLLQRRGGSGGRDPGGSGTSKLSGRTEMWVHTRGSASPPVFQVPRDKGHTATPSDAQDKGHQKGTGGRTPMDMAEGGRQGAQPGESRPHGTRPPRVFSLLIRSITSHHRLPGAAKPVFSRSFAVVADSYRSVRCHQRHLPVS